MRKIDIVTPVECPQLTPERQLLWDAANEMERRGKCENRLTSDDGRVCMLGALYTAATGDPNDRAKVRHDHPGFSLAYVRLCNLVGSRPIHVWSDAHDQATVVAAMRSAALS